MDDEKKTSSAEELAKEVFNRLSPRKMYWSANPQACFRFLQREYPQFEMNLDHLKTLAGFLSISPILIYTNYEEFTRLEQSDQSLQICVNLTCLGKGGGELKAFVLQHFQGLERDLELKFIMCLGSCSTGPCVQYQGKLHEKMDVERLKAMIS